MNRSSCNLFTLLAALFIISSRNDSDASQALSNTPPLLEDGREEFENIWNFKGDYGKSATNANKMSHEEIDELKEGVRDMFFHGFDNYMKYAFPHDELKPLSYSYTDSFVELGNLNMEGLPQEYTGIALTLIDSLSTLAVLGDNKAKEEFSKAVKYIHSNLSFDLDVRVNVFETDIRVLGSLLSAHLLASDPKLNLTSDYNGELLVLATDLGNRLLKAFSSKSGLPYAWVNLRHGVAAKETVEQCTAGIGTLIFEFEVLSYLTNDLKFANTSYTAVQKLWNLRSHIGLFGNTLNIETTEWKDLNSGIGAGSDSFYECLLKVYIMFGKPEYWNMFQQAYKAINTYVRHGSWYVEANMNTGSTAYFQFNSLQAFWPGLQVLVGDIAAARETFDSFFGLWKKYKLLPERYWISSSQLHATERYYVLRPELIESTFYLYTATQDDYFLQVAKHIFHSLNNYTKVPGGYTSVKNVESLESEDRMQSFFLAETCKYLYLLFDSNNFVRTGNYVFSTEGHLFPVIGVVDDIAENYVTPKCTNPYQQFPQKQSSSCHVKDKYSDYRCFNDLDCGIDEKTCKPRKCSQFFYCFTPHSV